MKKNEKKKEKKVVNTTQTLKKKFNMHIAETSAEHDLLMNSYLQTNKNNHSHSDSLCLAAHKMHVNEKKKELK